LYRLKGELLLQQALDNQADAETCFHHALDLARNQQVKSFELRTATNLAKLWRSQGKRQQAYDLLAPVYNWFTEGFDTADLKDAKALLDELEAKAVYIIQRDWDVPMDPPGLRQRGVPFPPNPLSRKVLRQTYQFLPGVDERFTTARWRRGRPGLRDLPPP
jgi:hypothetical protein